jgi:hypothetical protein
MQLPLLVDGQGSNVSDYAADDGGLTEPWLNEDAIALPRLAA